MSVSLFFRIDKTVICFSTSAPHNNCCGSVRLPDDILKHPKVHQLIIWCFFFIIQHEIRFFKSIRLLLNDIFYHFNDNGFSNKIRVLPVYVHEIKMLSKKKHSDLSSSWNIRKKTTKSRPFFLFRKRNW